MRLALVADWLTTFGGAEHTIAEFRKLWPASPLFTTVARRSALGPLADAPIVTSWLQRVYARTQKHQQLLPLLPRAIESLDLRGYDVILSSSHAVGKGIVLPGDAVHVCYCHTPMRYAWEMEKEYLDDFRVPRILRGFIRSELRKLRRWDLSTAKRVDTFIANSAETQRRIQTIYGRSAAVIHPPAGRSFFEHPLVPTEKRTSYLAIGRLVPYKRFDLLIDAANRRAFPLLIAGRGQEEKRLRAMAGPTVRFAGFVPDNELPSLYANAKALLFPPIEDAGIVPLEAQAAGTPVIALGKGGALDTIVEGTTGLFFAEQTTQSLLDAIDRFERRTFEPEGIRKHATRFSEERFQEAIRSIVEHTYDAKIRNSKSDIRRKSE